MSSSGETQYLGVADAIALHQAIMERTGYTPAPLRDEGLLDSALQRPRVAAYYEDGDLILQAVVLAVGIAQAQAFLGGNKRTVFAVLDVFLRLNERAFTGEPVALAQQLEQLANREDSLDAATGRFEAWLRERTA